MPPRTIVFDENESYKQNRPYAGLRLFGQRGCFQVCSLVDTGADYTLFPLAAASFVGLSPQTQGTQMSAMTASGIATVYRLTGVDIEVFGKGWSSGRVSITADFAAGAPSLLGLTGIFKAMESLGFTRHDWVQKWYPAASGSATASTGLQAMTGQEFGEWLEGNRPGPAIVGVARPAVPSTE